MYLLYVPATLLYLQPAHLSKSVLILTGRCSLGYLVLLPCVMSPSIISASFVIFCIPAFLV